MTLVELRYIVALAAEGSFSRAADRCAVSQPALSTAIARLEAELGVKIFERSRGLVRPSEAGARIVRQAQKVLAESETLRSIAREGRDQLTGPLRLGAIHTVGPYLLPQLIGLLREAAPAMPLVIEENMTAHLALMLRDGAIDAALLALPFEAPGVETRALYDEPFVVIAPPGHKLANSPALSPQDLTGEDMLLLKAGHCFRDQVLDLCPQGVEPEDETRLGSSIGTLRCMVASGLGLSVLPAGALGDPHAGARVQAIPFAAPEPTRRIALAFRCDFSRPRALDLLARCIRRLDSPVFRMIAQEKAKAA